MGSNAHASSKIIAKVSSSQFFAALVTSPRTTISMNGPVQMLDEEGRSKIGNERQDPVWLCFSLYQGANLPVLSALRTEGGWSDNALISKLRANRRSLLASMYVHLISILIGESDAKTFVCNMVVVVYLSGGEVDIIIEATFDDSILKGAYSLRIKVDGSQTERGTIIANSPKTLTRNYAHPSPYLSRLDDHFFRPVL